MLLFYRKTNIKIKHKEQLSIIMLISMI